jgi:hypothetical protein
MFKYLIVHSPDPENGVFFLPLSGQDRIDGAVPLVL